MGVVVRRYIDILTIIINFPYSTCISSFLAAASSLLLCSFLKCFFGLVRIRIKNEMAIFYFARRAPKLRYYGAVIHSFYWKSAVEHDGGV